MAGVGGAASVDNPVRSELEKAGIPSVTIDHIMSHKALIANEQAALNPDQMEAVTQAEAQLIGGKVGAGLAGALGGLLSLALIIGCFVGGLIGWILTMKKRVLQCGVCSAVVAAS